MSPASNLYIGLMSGTSVDGIDAVLVRVSGTLQTLGGVSLPMPQGLRSQLQALQQPAHNDLVQAALAANQLADSYAQAVSLLCSEYRFAAADIRALGAHGQTVRHQPQLGYTLQLLNGARLAEATGVPVVCDFRSGDVAAGGQGAPLVPAFHAGLFTSSTESRAIVNIGGIANVTLLPAGAESKSSNGPGILGFDTGPGNTLMDQWIHLHRGEAFDRHGDWAASGTVHQVLLSTLMADDYFRRPPPKSTGRDDFHLNWLRERLAQLPGRPPSAVDTQATLAELTASSIAAVCAAGVDALYVCGGGALNGHLMRRLSALMSPRPVGSTSTLGLDPLWVEAAAFAWLAYRRLEGMPGNLPSATGSRGPRVLGAIYEPFCGSLKDA